MRNVTSVLLAGALALGGVAASSTAASAAPVAPAAVALTPTSAPSLSGTLAPGGTVYATPGTWSSNPAKLTYTFYKLASNGYRVRVQSGSSNAYTLRNADNTYRIKVEVKAEATGLSSGTAWSPTSLHVLLPQQRALVTRFGGDWHDMYYAGTGSRTVTFPRVPFGAYVELSCAGTGSATLKDAAGRTLPGSDLFSVLSTAPGRTLASVNVAYDYRTGQGKLGGAAVTCSGAWSLVVRPTASAPTLYSAAKGVGQRGYVYTGPAALRTFTTTNPDLPLGGWMTAQLTWMSGAVNRSEFVPVGGMDIGQTVRKVMPATPLVLNMSSGSTWTIA